MVIDKKAHDSKLAATSASSSGQSPSAAETAPAPSYAEAAAASIGTAANPEPSSSAANTQPAAAPEDALIAQAPSQQRAATLGPDLEQPRYSGHGREQVEALQGSSRRAFKRFAVAFAWATLAWIMMIMVAGGATEVATHDLRQTLASWWRDVDGEYR